MKGLILVAILFVLAAWFGSCAAHWADKKAKAFTDSQIEQIDELTR